jgi:hypothetical protein
MSTPAETAFATPWTISAVRDCGLYVLDTSIPITMPILVVHEKTNSIAAVRPRLSFASNTQVAKAAPVADTIHIEIPQSLLLQDSCED